MLLSHCPSKLSTEELESEGRVEAVGGQVPSSRRPLQQRRRYDFPVASMIPLTERHMSPGLPARPLLVLRARSTLWWKMGPGHPPNF